MKLLVLCDSPTLETGFARVARNLLSRWNKEDVFEQIWVWGVGYGGFPHSIDFLANRICPASSPHWQNWYHVRNLERFLRLLEKDDVGGTPGGFTHLWMLQDTFLLYPMATALQGMCRDRGIRSLLYFPVDAPLEPNWCDIIEAVDFPVAYCNYGRDEAVRVLTEPKMGDEKPTKGRLRAIDRMKVIPHGVDPEIYKPSQDDKRQRDNRKILFKGRVGQDEFLMVNVNMHQKRKGVCQSLALLRQMKTQFKELSPRLFMHMPTENPDEQTNLRQIAVQMNLSPGEDVFFSDSSFERNHALLPEDRLNAIYNTADLLITTTYGEGWGLPITEAMAAGLPVAGPNHTSLTEIMAEDRGILFSTLGCDVMPWDMSRVRPRIDITDAAIKIANARMAQPQEAKSLHSYAQRGLEWARGPFLNWDRISKMWLELMLD